MENIHLLFDKNTSPSIKRKPTFRNKCAVYTCRDKTVTYDTLKRIIGFIQSLRRYGARIPIQFDFSQSPFLDKLTFVIFECICYVLISQYGYSVCVKLCKSRDIITEGIHSSPLLRLAPETKPDSEKFCKSFRNDLYKQHFRKIIPASAVMDVGISVLMQDIDSFLNNLDVKTKYRKKLAEMLVELVGNAGEHGKSECLIDIDVTNEYNKKNTDGKYRGLNVALVSFSEKQFADELKCKLTNDGIELPGERYLYVKRVFEKHKEFFNKNYGPNEFFMIAAFQQRISGRMDKSTSGGMGMTKLISSLEDMSDAHSCLMITGKKAIVFIRELLEYDEHGWLGFNHQNSFSEEPPDDQVFLNSELFVPGTAFNLCFVMREDIENE